MWLFPSMLAWLSLCWLQLARTIIAPSFPRASGPGAGPWQTAAPEQHGLSSSELAAAAKQLGQKVPHRYCLLAAVGGQLVHETYYSGPGRRPDQPNAADTKYESDSAGKTVSALLFGVAVTKGLVRVDDTLQSLGVEPQGEWAPGKSGAKWYPHVTVKNVLSQTTGVGKVKPGTSFTYDSDEYLGHLRLVLEKITGQPSQIWATEHFAKPLGLEGLYATSNDAGG